MRSGASGQGRFTPEWDRQETLRRRSGMRRRFALLPALAAMAAITVALAVALPPLLGAGKAGPTVAPTEAWTVPASPSPGTPPPSALSTTPGPSAEPLPSDTPAVAASHPIVNADGRTIAERFNPPPGFQRVAAEQGSFAGYLRNYPLRPDGAEVQYYDGSVKPDHAYLAVADMDLYGSRLQQCADTVLRLHAEYLYGRGEHGSIGYHFVSGFDFRWEKWRQGYRVKVDGNEVSWVRSGRADSSEQAFRAYLQQLYNYASTLSLEHYDMEPVTPGELAIGDVFLRGGSPGHVVLIVDMAEEPQSGRRCFILLQGYMPAQDAQILRNLGGEAISPWVMLPEEPSGDLQTPEYQFTWDQVWRFKTQND